MQRWHTDDLVGRLLAEQERLQGSGIAHDEWQIINFPAIAETDEEHRKQGEALWPAKFPIEVLENIRTVQGVYNWASQYQADPILSEFQEFKSPMFKYFEEAEVQGKYLRYYTMVDPAISQKKEADNTVVLTIAKEISGPNIYRIKESAGKFTPSQTVDLIMQHCQEFRSDCWIETVQYQQALKYAVIEEQKKRGAYFMVHELKTASNKETRIRGLLPLYNAGVIHHRKHDVEFERELLAFPRGKHDDRADVMSFLNLILSGETGGGVKQYKPTWRGYKKVV
jgi:predicted phage terminase large subunit-like protein